MAARIVLPVMEDKRPVRNRARRRHRPLLYLLVIAAFIYGLYNFGYLISFKGAFPSHSIEHVPASDPLAGNTAQHAEPAATRALVPLEAHIISKCPDTRDCLKELLLPAMIQVYQKVNFTLTYIGMPTENDGVECKHGPGECMGNIIELCAHQLYPDPKIWLGFTMCLTKDYRSIPQRELVEDCALEHAVDFDKINECATRDDGAFGMDMLRESVKRSASVCSTLDPASS
ncbi:hypothetical protein F5B22DRAFT_592316 [Xylaria bambusicola]|uniref:uncharacterized protein n=1 Tax=Xylaria bambusicola TaxID=326684 RepID=UPI0020083824|nr:uncharacterized protein F5B22DRAFT_592316 [Xylaria bambusicola]KAI0523861.1 hypothetical protein F5B22DRAFT_592316 [Xylaria bambusicola]